MTKNLWQEQARKLGGEALVDTVQQMADDINEVKQGMNKLLTAFPSGDTDGHARYHEAVIERTAELRRLRVAIQEKTISGLVWSAIMAIGVALWHEFASIIRFIK